MKIHLFSRSGIKGVCSKRSIDSLYLTQRVGEVTCKRCLSHEMRAAGSAFAVQWGRLVTAQRRLRKIREEG